MARPPNPRPALYPTPLNKAGGDSAIGNSTDFHKALLDAGLDPSIIPQSAKETPRDAADVFEDELVAEVLADDLTNSEATLLAGAMWTGIHSKNAARARAAWRLITFLLKYPAASPDDVPPQLLTDTFFASYRRPRTSLSSLIHSWSRMNVFAMARDRLNAYPLTRWSQHRRNQMDVICEWERQICERSEARRKERLLKKLKGTKK